MTENEYNFGSFALKLTLQFTKALAMSRISKKIENIYQVEAYNSGHT